MRSSSLLNALLLPALLVLVAGSCASAPRADRFPANPDPMAEVEAALERAAAGDRLTLIVLGADWCHDSRALASRLGEAPLAEVIGAHYESVLVDVGYYEAGIDVVQRFGVPIYYATPTVLIVDPETGRLVNEGDRHRWGQAASISMADSVGYFQTMAGREAPEAPSEALLPYLEQLAAFDAAQAARVAAGFEVLGPLLEILDQTGERPASFDERWRELAEFRNAIPRDIQRLRLETEARLARGERGFEIGLPSYGPFSWEE